ncbi:MAG: superoxide dismutase [Microbacteriaceae bacterium]|jgi:Fe-Mn family superoxide dismutase|nr:superoxide dismutase [Microbacteriaceae bacterium]
MAKYTLPELPYDFSALGSHISGAIVELHHDKHHAAYVKGVNAAFECLEAARNDDSLANVNKVQKDFAFKLGGRLNHSTFWNNLSLNGCARPSDTRRP